VIHGGAWTNGYDLNHIGHLAAALTARGIATWTIEFRRVGDPGGGYPNMLRDVAAAIDHLRHVGQEFSLDARRVFTIGHSSGGHLALWASGRGRVATGSPVDVRPLVSPATVVSIAGIGDLRGHWASGDKGRARVEGLMGGPPDRLSARYDSASPVDLLPLGVPVVLIHGTVDMSVPIEYSRRFATTARQRGDEVKLIEVDGAGHFEVIDPASEHWSAVEHAILETTASTALAK
jgi:acetyl esterase/lipase